MDKAELRKKAINFYKSHTELCHGVAYSFILSVFLYVVYFISNEYFMVFFMSFVMYFLYWSLKLKIDKAVRLNEKIERKYADIIHDIVHEFELKEKIRNPLGKVTSEANKPKRRKIDAILNR